MREAVGVGTRQPVCLQGLTVFSHVFKTGSGQHWGNNEYPPATVPTHVIYLVH